jgi:subtilase family serine protease
MRKTSNCRPTRRARYVRPEFEELENRIVPALTPLQVRHAYGFDQIAFSANGKTITADGSGQTIAIINAYNQPHIASDLNTFDQVFGINGKQSLYQQYGPASSFLTVANPEGAPLADPTGGLWNLETSLDVEWVHAIAPGAKILLVQARTGSMSDLLNAVNWARNQSGVVAVSMSWGAGEFSGENFYDSYFTTPSGHLGGSNGIGGAKLPGGVTFVAAAGDSGAPGLWPAMSPDVLAVGGTTLTVSSTGVYQGETAWSDSGGGVSKFEKKPAFQAGFGGSMRSAPDVSYNGNPTSGVYVYDSMPLYGTSGWWQVGGTSAGTPQWAALIAIADQGRALQGKGSLDGASQTLPAIYAMSSSDFHDVTKGSNGFSATVGYDLVTGRGSPVVSKVVADLIRATSQGKVTTTAATGIVALAGIPASVTTSLDFVTVDSPGSTLPASGIPATFVAATRSEQPTATNPRPTDHPTTSTPFGPTPADVRMRAALFANGADWLGMDDDLPCWLDVLPDDTADRDTYFSE